MKTLWEKRIEHIDRRVRPLQMRGLKSRLIKDAVRARQGIPSRSAPAELVFEALHIQLESRRGDQVDPLRSARLEFALRKHRLLERKRRQRSAARRHTKPNTKINLWRRRQEWLRQAEELRAR